MALEFDYSKIINEAIAQLSEEEFWKLVDNRLNLPFLRITEKYKDRQFWTEEYLIQELFLQLAGTKEIVKHEGRCINVYKYYSQAFALRYWIPITKPIPEFIVNMTDLTTRIITELRTLDKDGSQYVLKQAVGRIFDNINSKQYHLSIARKLKVRLDK